MRFDELEEQRQLNRDFIQEKYAERILAIKNCFNAQYEYAKLFHGFMGQRHFTNHSDAEAPILSAVFKNEIALYSSFIDIVDGFTGSAMVHLRSVYEALIIAKFSSLRGDDKVIDKWKAGETIYFSKAIFKKILKPELAELKKLWEPLCQYSHATIYSYQIITNAEDLEQEIGSSFAILSILLGCQFHLINKHYITESMVYIAKNYHSEDKEGEFQRRRDAAKIATKAVTQFVSKVALKVIIPLLSLSENFCFYIISKVLYTEQLRFYLLILNIGT